ncbi:hypothetical protein Tco_1120195 [Tanacetum coccineum]
MESSTSSQPYQPYSPINPTNLDMNFEELMFSQEYNYSQDYSMGHEVSPVKPKKPSRRLTKAKKDETKEVKEAPKEWQWRKRLRCAKGRKKSKTSETTSGLASGGINLKEEADEAVQETQEFRSMGRDRAKVKKKAAGSSSSIW